MLAPLSRVIAFSNPIEASRTKFCHPAKCPSSEPGMKEYADVHVGALGLEPQIIPKAGHLSIDDGFGPWQAMIEWCLTGATDWGS